MHGRPGAHFRTIGRVDPSGADGSARTAAGKSCPPLTRSTSAGSLSYPLDAIRHRHREGSWRRGGGHTRWPTGRHGRLRCACLRQQHADRHSPTSARGPRPTHGPGHPELRAPGTPKPLGLARLSAESQSARTARPVEEGFERPTSRSRPRGESSAPSPVSVEAGKAALVHRSINAGHIEVISPCWQTRGSGRGPGAHPWDHRPRLSASSLCGRADAFVELHPTS